MSDFIQTLITAMAIGSLYALIALGYTMVYGILKFINFAHSDIVVLGAWVSYTLAIRLLPLLGLDPHNPATVPPIWVAAVVLLAAMTYCGVVGFAIERLAYRRLRRAPRLNVLITAIGVSLFLQNVGQLDFMFGASPQKMPTLLPSWELASFTFGEGESARRVVIGLIDVVIFSLATILMLVMQYMVFHTKLGVAMRAVAYNTDTAALMGIPVDRVVSFTFVFGSVLASAAGFLFVMKYPGMNQPAHAIWVLLGLKAFVAAVIGGIGNVRGAVLGGFVIAFVEQFGAFYISSNYRDVYVFALLILILLVKPSGLLGSPLREKV
ncbi:MAG TPA: branched-chain amino acid ABC transporter permease [Planctomycetaceae bacterium]|nr:branched-chain amino acid ABC transporter permease [Planctomycetaceae bacterium]